MRENEPPLEEPRAVQPQRRRLWLVGLVISLVLALSAVLGLGLTRNPRLLPSVLEARPAPDFSLRDMDTGNVVRLRELRGQVVVVNFWASWCVSCKEEHPNFVAAWDRYRDRGVVFVGILFQDTVENGRAYMEELGGGWPSLVDPDSRTAIRYGVYGVPETFFVARDGTIAHKRVGPTTYFELVGWVERLLRHPGARGS